MKLERSRVLAQVNARSLKATVIEPGTTVSVIDIDTKELDNGQPNDMLLCETSNGLLNIPVREYLKMTVVDGKAYTAEDGDTEVEILDQFTVVSSEDRKSRDGETIYPSYAYNAFDEQRESGNFSWNDLVASGLKADFNGPAVQNYTVKGL